MRKLMAAGAACLMPLAAVAEPFDSAYTTHDYQACPVVRQQDGSVERRCKGLDGIAVNWFGADDDAIVDFGRKSGSASADGLSFATARPTIEWRGPKLTGGLKPVAAVVRYGICTNIEGKNCRDALYVYRLNGKESSCVMAVVDGRARDANARARQVIDTGAEGFRCGKYAVRR